MRVTRAMIHPELRLPGALMRWLFAGNRSEESLRRGEPAWLRWLGRRAKLKGSRRESASVQRPDGSALRLLVVRPVVGGKDLPAILWLHGGGYSMGSPEMELRQMGMFLAARPCLIVAPAYRLSKHAPYPAALDDSYAALLWLRRNARRLCARDDQIIVAGGSAGGGLTAATTLLARDRGEVAVAFQMPLYPMIDDRGNTPSMIDNDAPVYDAVSNRSNWRIYLGALHGGDVPAYAAPARAIDHAGLPPTISFVGGIDPFRDETVTYVAALRAAGVPTEFREFPGCWHGFEGIAFWTGVAREARAWIAARYVEALDRWSAPQPVEAGSPPPAGR